MNIASPGTKGNQENKVEAAGESADLATDDFENDVEDDDDDEWYIDPVVPEEPQPLVGPTSLFFRPLDTRTPLIIIPITEKLETIARNLDKYSKKLFLVRIEGTKRGAFLLS